MAEINTAQDAPGAAGEAGPDPRSIAGGGANAAAEAGTLSDLGDGLEPAFFAQARELLAEIGYEEPSVGNTSIEDVFAALRSYHGKVAQLEDELDSAAKALDKAKAKAVSEKPASVKARAIKPMESAVDRQELVELLAGPVEIVASDGKRELIGIRPLAVAGAVAWAQRAGGWMLRERITADGPAPGAPPYQVAGFGLLDANGKQVAWSPLHEVLPIAGGSKVQFRDSIIFGA